MSTQFLNLQEGTIAYDDIGRGPLVVCAPSMGDLRSEFRFLNPYLTASGYRVVTMDLRGLGESSPTWSDYSVAGVGMDMAALVRHLDAGPAAILGVSMSAGAAVWAAAEAPELVSGLVLIGPFVRGEASALNRLLYSALFTKPWGPAAWLWYYGTLYPTRKPTDFAAYSAALRANLNESGRLPALRQMMMASKAASEARLARVTAPSMILMGSKDPDFKEPEAEARWVADSVRGRYHMVPEAGHYPHAEMPETVAPLITSFLETLPSQQVKEHAS